MSRKTKIQRFTAYRRNMNERDTHNENQKNDESEPQFEGVIWSDGTVTIRWLTPLRSHSVWDSLDDMLGVHGHPEYGTVIVWHDGDAPEAWKKLQNNEAQANKKDEESDMVKYVYIEGSTVEVPRWTNYIGRGTSGSWWAYEDKPEASTAYTGWIPSGSGTGRYQRLQYKTKHWKDTLQSV